MKLYRLLSLVLMLLFAVTGLLFLFLPDKVLIFFNAFSPVFGLPQSPVVGWNFYVILTSGYMYLVTVLAFLMFRHPENRSFPFILIHGKLASSVLSLALFLFHAHYLIFLANFIIDGIIGLVVLILYFKMRSTAWVYS
jgi:hypothetical protein